MLKRFLNNHLKFQVRVRHYSKEYYTIEYSWKRLPFWFGLYKFDSWGLLSNWSPILFTPYSSAERYAEKYLRSYRDVLNFQEQEQQKYQDYKKSSEIQIKIDIPYTSKEINIKSE